MKCSFHQCMALLACVLLAAGDAGAAGRESGRKATASASGKSDAWRPVQEAWLARLQGSFAIKLKLEEKIGACLPNGVGQQKCEVRKPATYVSAADCRRIGEGPGLHCTFEALRPEVTGDSGGDAGAAAFLGSNGLPTRMLFGIDPVARKIKALVMDGAAGYESTGSPSGDAITFKGRCDMLEIKRPCSWSLSIQASPDGTRVLMTRVRQNVSGSQSSSLFMSADYEPHRYELSRVEQPAQPQN